MCVSVCVFVYEIRIIQIALAISNFLNKTSTKNWIRKLIFSIFVSMFLLHFALFVAENTHMHIGIDRNHFNWQIATMAYEKKRERISKSRRKKSNCILYVSRRVTSTAVAAAIASNASIVFCILLSSSFVLTPALDANHP